MNWLNRIVRGRGVEKTTDNVVVERQACRLAVSTILEASPAPVPIAGNTFALPPDLKFSLIAVDVDEHADV
jgi:hypothetical protein